MGFQLHETVYGKRFFEGQLPSLIKAINRLADAKEKELETVEPEQTKAVNMVYVCFEENSHELATENGAVNEMYVAASLNDVYKWIDKRLKEAEQNYYSILNDLDESDFYKNIIAGKEGTLPLYHNGDESSRLFYALTVKPFTSANGLYTKAAGKTYDRLRAVMTNMEKAEKLGDALCEQMETDDEKHSRIGYYLAKAILDDSIEDLLVAICGWTSESLLNIAEFGTANPKEDKK